MYWNRFDVFLVAICLLTLGILLFGTHCSPGQTREEELSTIILVLRNGIAFSRSLLMIQKNGSQFLAGGGRVKDLDLNSVSSIPLAMDALQDFEPDSTVGRGYNGHSARMDRSSIDYS